MDEPAEHDLMECMVAAPRYGEGQYVIGKFRITNVLVSGHAFQILRGYNISDGAGRVIKVINRANVSDFFIQTEIRWMRHASTSDGRHAHLISDYKDTINAFLVFRAPKMTLATVVKDVHLRCLPYRHVREIARQLTRAVSFLHQESIIHSDIAPQNIEFDDHIVIRQLVRNSDGVIEQRHCLRSRQLCLSYYGCAGIDYDHRRGIGSDQYRAPEVVYGWRVQAESDIFSIGCIIAELILHRPLFPRLSCSHKQGYRQEKTLLYYAVLGTFPPALVHRLRECFPAIYSATSDFPKDDHVDRSVEHRLKEPDTLSELFAEDVDVLEVVASMTYPQLSDRTSLFDIQRRPFFTGRH